MMNAFSADPTPDWKAQLAPNHVIATEPDLEGRLGPDCGSRAPGGSPKGGAQ